MARKIQIDIEVNGKMQKATVDAKKLNAQLQGVDEGLDNVSKSSRTADRNIKGTAQASSNASKNFSKMQQGMGGLVGAYASLAASLFAVSAAFNFLKSAGELKSLRAGQIAYASSTGVAINTLTDDIIRATDSQIAFRDAAQAAAIGSAAGLNADQLVRLGKAAADASQILGRDVTDSFNRLVRGATKAEPELLDELGIILRLDDASQKYATSLGINATELTTFQKQQAVTNDILEQAEEKYGRILDIVGRSPNQYAQLQKAFDDIIMSVKDVVDMVAGPLAKVLQETPALAVASLGVLLSGPMRALGLSFTGIADAARDSATSQKTFYRAVRQEVKLASKSTQDYKKDLRSLANVGIADGAKAGFLTTLSKGKDLGGAEVARFNSAVKAAENNVNSSGVVIKGAFTGMKIHMVREMAEAYASMNAAQDNTLRKTELFALRSKAAIAGISASVKVAAAAIAGIFSKVLSMVSYGALAFTGFSMYKEFTQGPLTEQEKEMQANAEATKAFQERLAKLNKEFEKFAEIQMELGKTQGVSAYGNLSGLFGGQNPEQTKRMLIDFKKLGKEQEKMAANAKEMDFIDNAAMAVGGLGFLATASTFGGIGAGLGSMALPGIGTAIGGLLGVATAAVASLIASDVFIEPIIDEAREAGKISDEITGGDSQARTARNQQREETEKRLLQLRDGILAVQESSGAAYAPVTKFLAAVDQILTSDVITQEMIDQFEEAKKGAVNFSDSMKAADSAIKAGKDSLAQFIAQAAKLTPAQQTLQKLREQQEGLDFKLKGTFTDPEERKKIQDQRDLVTFQISAAEKIADLELSKRDIAISAKEQTLRLIGDETKEEQRRIKFHNDIVDLAKQRKLIETDIAALQATKSITEDPTLQSALQDQLDLLGRELLIIFDQIRDRTKQYMHDTDQTNLENLKAQDKVLGINKQLLDLEKKRLDFAQQMLDLEKARDDRQIDRTEVEERLRNPFYYIDQDNRRAKMELDSFNKRYDREKQLILARAKQADAAIRAEYALLRHRVDITRADAKANQTFSPDMEAGLTSLTEDLATTETAARAAAAAGAQDELEQLEHKKFMLESQIQLTSRLQEAVEDAAQSMEENFTNAFAAIIDGSANGKEAFKMLAESMLQDISRIIAKLLVQQMIMSTMNMLGGIFGAPATGGVPTNISTLPASGRANFTPGAFDFSGRYGGIMKKGYSTGGIARGSDAGYLATLHGTEAVVPLPNGRSIPVEMSGAGAQTNNVSVNVNVQNDGRADTTTEGDSKEMGKAIAAAVQREIQTQRRPGGLLSPYGAR